MSVKVQCKSCNFLTELDESEEVANCTNCRSLCNVPTTIEPGVVVDDYLVKKLLGKGGKGNVYLAHELTLDRDVALKVLEKNFQDDLTEKESLLKEARSVASLNHPNIVHALKFGEFKGTLYFVMELVEGQTLQKVIEKAGKVNEDKVIRIAIEITNALKHAWEKCKLIHSDIKPDNIMISVDGTAKLTDLGLSQHYSEIEVEQHNTISGTPQYISPEQVLGETVDLRSDFYSLGATLFHAVTGRFMYISADVIDMLMKHVKSPIPKAIDVNPAVSENFSNVIYKMVSKNKENRYQSCDELLDALNDCLGRAKNDDQATVSLSAESAAQVQSEVKMEKSKSKIIVALVLVLCLGLVSIPFFKKGNDDPNKKITEKKPIEEVKKPAFDLAFLDKRIASFTFVKDNDPAFLKNEIESAGNLHGVIHGATWAAGPFKESGALEFKYPEDHVNIQIPNVLKSFTVTAWVKINNLSNEYNSIISSDDFYRKGSLHWQINQDGRISSAVYVKPGIANSFNFDAYIKESDFYKWKFLTLSFDSEKSSIKVFSDGEYMASKIIDNPTLIHIDKAQIGNWAAENRNFNGLIGKLEVFEIALNAKQIADLYKAQIPLK